MPTEGILVTHFLSVRDVASSRAFYADALGGQVVMAENPRIVKLPNSWLIRLRNSSPSRSIAAPRCAAVRAMTDRYNSPATRSRRHKQPPMQGSRRCWRMSTHSAPSRKNVPAISPPMTSENQWTPR